MDSFFAVCRMLDIPTFKRTPPSSIGKVLNYTRLVFSVICCSLSRARSRLRTQRTSHTPMICRHLTQTQWQCARPHLKLISCKWNIGRHAKGNCYEFETNNRAHKLPANSHYTPTEVAYHYALHNLTVGIVRVIDDNCHVGLDGGIDGHASKAQAMRF